MPAALVLGNGETYALLYELQRLGGHRLCNAAMDMGAVVVGVSAGAICLGLSAETALWKGRDMESPPNAPEAWAGHKDGMALVPTGFSVFVHDAEEHSGVVADRCGSLPGPLLTLTDEQHVSYVGGRQSVLDEDYEFLPHFYADDDAVEEDTGPPDALDGEG
eukprot:CAMPEP_0183807156 /NCGR_PEP_ID=MMETSP0803_2-20130417/40775_1 /TAXON_ID=195967 /ORGANISM="Crustomastix stigmata, Strain CCMP3273" /LENGTH=161 /DNA_ID=CAMNT_0026051929 /DNA_START=18 /DNA_END=500 /DNA_ORIENTATION=+